MSKTTQKEPSLYIKVTQNGPYLVFGDVDIQQHIIQPNQEGHPWEYLKGEKYKSAHQPCALCRCGQSKKKPFCDGTHKKVDFDGTEMAPRENIMEKATAYKGPHYTLYDNELYCAFARFCDAFGQIWNLVREGRLETDELAVRETGHCCAGRLMIQNNETGEMIEPKLEKSIGVIEDPLFRTSGPLYIKGGIQVVAEDGTLYEIRNRQTLCRCGASQNKPFCDGTHASMRFDDGLMKSIKKAHPRRRKAPPVR